MSVTEVVVSPLRDLWIVEWRYASGRRRAQHPHVFVKAGIELRLRSAASWSPTSAIVIDVDGKRRLLPLGG